MCTEAVSPGDKEQNFCPAVYGLDDSAVLSVLIQLLKAMFKYKAEVLISLPSSLSWTLGKRGTDQRGGRLVPCRARLHLS